MFNKTDYQKGNGKNNPDILFNPIKTKGFVNVKYNVENGPIKKGDLITPSSVEGVGMKVIKPRIVVGIALEDTKNKKGLVKTRLMIQYVSL